MPKISVLLPVYNAEQYLIEAVQSILNQSFRDFELLAHDDGSTDHSLDLLRNLAARDPRIIISSAPNRGITPTLNLLVQKAQAPYLARMDADDIALPDRFERQVAYLDTHPECIVVGARAKLIDNVGRELKVFDLPTSHTEIDSSNLRGSTAIMHPTVLMRAASVREIGGYREDFKHAEDIDLWLRLAEIGQLANLEEVLLKYRLHFQSVGLSKRKEQIASHVSGARDAYIRRGIPGEPHISLSTDSPSEGRAATWRRWGWWALQGGNIKTARYYAVRVVCARPANIENWRLMACALRGY